MNQTDKIRTVLVEDERKSMLTLQALLQRYCPEVSIVGMGNSVQQGIRVINDLNPELVFLDISMPDGDAFDLLSSIDDIGFEIIFVTAYNEYALKAFEFSAIHYLLKPVSYIDLQEAVKRFTHLKSDLQIKERIQILNQSLQNNYLKISLPTQEGLIIVEINSILRIEASSNYSIFHLVENESIIVSKPLNHFEDIFKDLNFQRIHNTNIVNLKYIKKYQKGRGGLVSLTDGTQVPVAAARKNDFLAALNNNIVNLP